MKVKKTRSNLKSFIRENLLQFLVWVAFVCVPLLFIRENIGRTVVIELLLLLWVVISIIKRNFVLSSLALLIFTFPLNITATFPSLGDPFVRGVITNYLSPTVSVLDIFMLLTFIIFISTRIVTFKNVPKWMYMIVAYFILHILLHPNIVTAVGSLRISLYVPTLVFSVRYFKGLRRKELIFLSFFAAIVLQVLIAGLQVYMGRSVGLGLIGESQLLAGSIGSSFIETASGVYLRGYGTFPHPNIFAAFMLMSLSVLFWLKGIPRKYSKYRMICIILSSFGVILSFSRIALFLLGVLFILYFVKCCMAKRTYAFTPFIVFERITNLLTNTDNSWRDRVELMKHSFKVIKEYWLFGIGQNNYVTSMRDVYVMTSSNLLLLQPVHNVPLLLLSEHGVVVGSLMIIGLIYQMTRRLFVKKDKFFVISNLLIILFFGLNDHFFVTLPQGLFTIIILLFI